MIEAWMLIHEVSQFIAWAWKFAPDAGMLAALFVAGVFGAVLLPMIGGPEPTPKQIADDPVLQAKRAKVPMHAGDAEVK